MSEQLMPSEPSYTPRSFEDRAALSDARFAWHQAHSGIDPKDHPTEQGYLDALNAARKTDDFIDMEAYLNSRPANAQEVTPFTDEDIAARRLQSDKAQAEQEAATFTALFEDMRVKSKSEFGRAYNLARLVAKQKVDLVDLKDASVNVKEWNKIGRTIIEREDKMKELLGLFLVSEAATHLTDSEKYMLVNAVLATAGIDATQFEYSTSTLMSEARTTETRVVEDVNPSIDVSEESAARAPEHKPRFSIGDRVKDTKGNIWTVVEIPIWDTDEWTFYVSNNEGVFATFRADSLTEYSEPIAPPKDPAEGTKTSAGDLDELPAPTGEPYQLQPPEAQESLQETSEPKFHTAPQTPPSPFAPGSGPTSQPTNGNTIPESRAEPLVGTATEKQLEEWLRVWPKDETQASTAANYPIDPGDGTNGSPAEALVEPSAGGEQEPPVVQQQEEQVSPQEAKYKDGATVIVTTPDGRKDAVILGSYIKNGGEVEYNVSIEGQILPGVLESDISLPAVRIRKSLGEVAQSYTWGKAGEGRNLPDEDVESEPIQRRSLKEMAGSTKKIPRRIAQFTKRNAKQLVSTGGVKKTGNAILDWLPDESGPSRALSGPGVLRRGNKKQEKNRRIATREELQGPAESLIGNRLSPQDAREYASGRGLSLIEWKKGVLEFINKKKEEIVIFDASTNEWVKTTSSKNSRTEIDARVDRCYLTKEQIDAIIDSILIPVA